MKRKSQTFGSSKRLESRRSAVVVVVVVLDVVVVAGPQKAEEVLKLLRNWQREVEFVLNYGQLKFKDIEWTAIKEIEIRGASEGLTAPRGMPLKSPREGPLSLVGASEPRREMEIFAVCLFVCLSVCGFGWQERKWPQPALNVKTNSDLIITQIVITNNFCKISSKWATLANLNERNEAQFSLRLCQQRQRRRQSF